MLLATAATVSGYSGDNVRRYYVSIDGSDTSPGTEKRPFATLRRAQDAVRSLKTTGFDRPVEVVVLPGTYYLDQPLVFTPDDSGTERCPITYKAKAAGKVILSGGRKIAGWRKLNGRLWTADVPQAKHGEWNFRLLRVGDEWAVRARHPNYDPVNPLKGGWLFAKWHGEPWERGLFGHAVGNLHEAGTKLTWEIRVPADGLYRVWVRYSSKMKDFGVDDMGGRTALQVDGGEPIGLMNLPDTGNWGEYRWSHSADLHLKAGEHSLAWINLQGGGLGLDAIILTNDYEWNPEKAIGEFSWWGAYQMTPPSLGKHVILIQAESCSKVGGTSVTIPDGTPPGETAFMRFGGGDIPRWKEVSGAELHIFPAWGWVNGIIPIERIDYEDRKIVFRGNASQDIRMGNRYYIENVREALDAEGEWFLDANDGKLFYLSSVRKLPEIVAPRLNSLIALRGDASSGRFVEYLRFEGFVFTDTDYTLSADYYTPSDSTITMSGARNSIIADCEFRWLGGYALKLEERSAGVKFIGNDIHHMGQGGVILLGRTDNQPTDNLIAGNTMRHLGLIYKHVAAVYVTTGSRNRIAHNTISDVTRYAVALKSYDSTAASHDNIVEYNDIRRCNLETNDTGCIETLGRDQEKSGNVIRYNLIFDSVGIGTTPDGRIISPYFNWGIYLDDYSSGTSVYGNIVARNANGAINVHGGKDNLFENNIFVGSANEQIRLQPRDEFMKGNRFVRNIVVWSRADSPLIYSWNRGSNTFSEWDYNLYWLIGVDFESLDRKSTPAGTFADWRLAGNDVHSLVADPLFVDTSRDDYRLRKDSPAFRLGFRPIPVDRIGAEYWRKERK